VEDSCLDYRKPDCAFYGIVNTRSLAS